MDGAPWRTGVRPGGPKHPTHAPLACSRGWRRRTPHHGREVGSRIQTTVFLFWRTSAHSRRLSRPGPVMEISPIAHAQEEPEILCCVCLEALRARHHMHVGCLAQFRFRASSYCARCADIAAAQASQVARNLQAVASRSGSAGIKRWQNGRVQRTEMSLSGRTIGYASASCNL